MVGALSIPGTGRRPGGVGGCDGPSSLGMGDILGKNRPQMSSAQDQGSVGDFGPGGGREPFAQAFALGDLTGVLMISMPLPTGTSANTAVDLLSRSDVKLEPAATARSITKVAGLQVTTLDRSLLHGYLGTLDVQQVVELNNALRTA